MSNTGIGWLLLVALVVGAVAGYFVHPDCSTPLSRYSESYTDSIIDHNRAQSVAIKSLEMELATIEPEKVIVYETRQDIEVRHATRDSLHFDIRDTGARYSFFAERFPNLSAYRGGGHCDTGASRAGLPTRADYP